jgi:hypothetical protein
MPSPSLKISVQGEVVGRLQAQLGLVEAPVLSLGDEECLSSLIGQPSKKNLCLQSLDLLTGYYCCSLHEIDLLPDTVAD